MDEPQAPLSLDRAGDSRLLQMRQELTFLGLYWDIGTNGR
jgi:hypothetical protein